MPNANAILPWKLRCKNISIRAFCIAFLLTVDLDVDEVGVARAHRVHGHAGDVRLRLERDGVDGPVEGGDVINHMTAAPPDVLRGQRPAGLLNRAGQRNSRAFDHHIGVLRNEGLPGRICN